MLNQAHLQLDPVRNLKGFKEQTSNSGITNQNITSVSQNLAEEKIHYSEQLTSASCIRLSFDELKSFEILDNQFQDLGIIFDNGLVIQPSNPAFPSRSGLKVVMGSPKSGFLEVIFLRPVNWVSILVTSSQRLVIQAHNQNEELLDESVLPAANLATSSSDIPPNTMLSVAANDIRKVSFFCFDGHFTLDEFRFCFST